MLSLYSVNALQVVVFDLKFEMSIQRLVIIRGSICKRFLLETQSDHLKCLKKINSANHTMSSKYN